MDPDAFVDALEADRQTELSRLGSSKALYAVTGGRMDADTVRTAVAARARAAAEAFEAWAADVGDAAPDGTATAFADAAAVQREAADRLDPSGDDSAAADADVPAPGPLFDHLAGLDGPVDRAAGLAAWALVADATLTQAVGYFVGSADDAGAETFRALREDLGPVRDRARQLLADACADAADWDRAVEAGGATIDAAYAGYVAVLEDLGITVKPIC